jgi:hypothetical protein
MWWQNVHVQGVDGGWRIWNLRPAISHWIKYKDLYDKKRHPNKGRSLRKFGHHLRKYLFSEITSYPCFLRKSQLTPGNLTTLQKTSSSYTFLFFLLKSSTKGWCVDVDVSWCVTATINDVMSGHNLTFMTQNEVSLSHQLFSMSLKNHKPHLILLIVDSVTTQLMVPLLYHLLN